jgi:hypothetical protein
LAAISTIFGEHRALSVRDAARRRACAMVFSRAAEVGRVRKMGLIDQISV